MDELNEKIGAVLRDLGITVLTDAPSTHSTDEPDVLVKLPTAHGEILTVVEVKNRAAMTPVELEKWRSRHPEGAILGCDYVTPSLARRLRAAGMEYVDGAGNAFISRPGLRVQVEGQRPQPVAMAGPPIGNHPPALGPASLRVVFALLVKPTLTGATFDELTEVAGVAKGTVHNTMNDLESRGYITGHRRRRRLLDYTRLAEIWVDGYASQLLPRLDQQRRRGPDPSWWAKPAKHRDDIVVGGGPALAHYGGLLRPEVTIVYGPPPWIEARKLGHLTSEGSPNVILRERFWSPHLFSDAQFVHPLLAYADALAGGDSREIEVARDLRDQGLVPL